MDSFWQYIVPGLVAVAGNIVVLALIKSRFDKGLERYKIAEGGIYSERINIYQDLNKKIYRLHRAIQVYYHTGYLSEGVDSISQAVLNLQDYSVPLFPFLSIRITEKIENLFGDFKEIGFDIKKHLEAKHEQPNYQQITDKYYDRSDDLFRSDSNLALLMKQVEFEMRPDLGTYESSLGSPLPIRGVNTNLSYLVLREIIGWAGLLLPAFLIIIAWFYNSSPQHFYQPSISHYYYTVSGFLFIGLITLIGVFLISYRGYEPEKNEISDNIITWIGGVLILIVAIVPTPFEWIECYHPTPIAHNHSGWGWLHFGSAVGFFLAMSYLSIKKFTKGREPFTPDKIKRNRIYRLGGWAMIGVLGIAGIIIFLTEFDDEWNHFIFWVEVLLLVLFGISWLVKGKGLVRLGIQQDDNE